MPYFSDAQREGFLKGRIFAVCVFLTNKGTRRERDSSARCTCKSSSIPDWKRCLGVVIATPLCCSPHSLPGTTQRKSGTTRVNRCTDTQGAQKHTRTRGRRTSPRSLTCAHLLSQTVEYLLENDFV